MRNNNQSRWSGTSASLQQLKTKNQKPITLLTVVLNAASTIRYTIESVLGQDYPNVEYIIIDGGSTDGTLEIIRGFGDRITLVVSEPDKGMYDALNKGIALATGDIVGSLNADDIYTSPDILSRVAEVFSREDPDTVFADVHFVREPGFDKTVRYISGRRFRPWHLRFGFMPPHPTFFVKRDLFTRLGGYRTNYHIAADYELIIRFLYKAKAGYRYIPLDMIRMRAGGKSTNSIYSKYILNREIYRACRENGIYTNIFILFMRYFVKVFEFYRPYRKSKK